MDTPLSTSLVSRQKRKTTIVIVSIVAILTVAIWLLRVYLSSSVEQSAIITAVVETGDIDNTLEATGEVLPEFEQVITSPINAVIKNVLLDAGTPVKAGQSVLELDKEFTQLELDKLKYQLELKENNITKLKLEVNKSFYDLKANDSIKLLRINSLQAKVQDAKRLLKAGGGTREEVEQAELDLKVAQLEKRQLENEIRNKQLTMQTEIRESEITAQIQLKDLNELERKLQQANIVATRNGVITWVNKNIGSTIREGESLVKVADLGSYKVTGNISDTYAAQVHSGMPVVVRINDSLLRGEILNIHPAVQNSIVSFDVQLTDRSSKLLRPNLKVDLFLVTETHNNIMRVANGAAFNGGKTLEIFVVQDGKAIRRTVNIGLSNFDHVEIKNNVKPGDVIITSDMSQYKHLSTVTIQK
ncbi:MAG: HlyD family efflux transporter periplasmic adaptor subunit [Chitinophagaceae bacterium]